MTGGFRILALDPVKNISDKGSSSIVVIQKENGSGSAGPGMFNKRLRGFKNGNYNAINVEVA